MNSSRLIAIGDIHGEYDKLDNLIQKIAPAKDDTIVFTGDYIDHGKNSKLVIDYLIKLSKTINCIFLKGNHESLLITAKNNELRDVANWYVVGGFKTLKNYGGSVDNIFRTHGEFFENLKLYHMTDKYFFVHGGINSSKSLDEQTEDDLLWIRHSFINYPHNLKQKVVFGHTPFDKPYIGKDKIGIDTGCGKYKDAKLTAFICDDEIFIQSDN